MVYDYNKLVEDFVNAVKVTTPERSSDMMEAMLRANTQLQKSVNGLTRELEGVMLENTNLKKQNVGIQNALLESQNERRELKKQNERLKSLARSIKTQVSYFKTEDLA